MTVLRARLLTGYPRGTDLFKIGVDTEDAEKEKDAAKEDADKVAETDGAFIASLKLALSDSVMMSANPNG